MVAGALIAAAHSGCTNQSPPDDSGASNDDAQPVAASPWLPAGDDAHVVVVGSAAGEHDDASAAMDRAIAEAQRTMDEARERWQVATADERLRWSIKWSARTLEGGVEHLWVRPTHWSQWRIEGILLSEPTRELSSGAAAGDAVGFPVDELTDWLYLIDGRVNGPRNGGFTLDALAERYGRPPDSRSG